MSAKNKDVCLKAIIIAVAIILLGFMDAVVLEKIYKPIAEKFGISFSEFIMPGFFGSLGMLWWHFAFFIGGGILFLLLSLSLKDWRVLPSGILLFFTGWEDIAYYAVMLQRVPEQLAWLDANPLVAWPRYILGTEHLTNIGLAISAIVGLGAVLLIFNYKKIIRKYFKEE